MIMMVTVLLFASYADRLGARQINVDLDTNASVGDLVQRVRAFPGGSDLPDTPLVAVNERYAAMVHRLTAGDEVALIPPVAGG